MQEYRKDIRIGCKTYRWINGEWRVAKQGMGYLAITQKREHELRHAGYVDGYAEGYRLGHANGVREGYEEGKLFLVAQIQQDVAETQQDMS